MDVSSVPGFISNLVSSVLTGVLVPLIIGLIQRQRGWPTLKKSAWVTISVAVGALVFATLFFIHPKPQAGLTLTELQTAAPVAQPDGETLYEVEVRGTVTHWKENVYLVVKPFSSAYWYIQQPVNLVSPIDKDGSNWEGVARFETAAPGDGEQFSIYALATSARYAENEELKTEPAGVKSNVKILTGRNIAAGKQ